MSRSTYATEHFDFQREKVGITRGLETIGETRFGTVYWSGESVVRGMPAFKVIIEDETLEIQIPVGVMVRAEIGGIS